METQPIVLFIMLLGARLFGDDALFPDALSITLTMLSLHWWLMWLRYKAEQQQKIQKIRSTQLPTPDIGLCFLGIFLVLAIYSLLHIEELANSQFVTTSLLMLGWSSWRAIYQSQENLNDQLLARTFRICFFIMLFILFLALLKSFAGQNDLINTTASDLPLFFITGVIGLSFTRIGTIQREREKQSGTPGKESIGSWITGLTVTWIVVVLISILLESVPLQIISSLFNGLWSVLGIIANAILFVFGFAVDAVIYIAFFIIALIYRLLPHTNTTAPPKVVPPTGSAKAGSAFPAQQIIFFVLLIAVVIGIILLLRRTRHKSKMIVSDEEEEVREQLNRADILKGREQERKNQQRTSSLETLAPDSMRLHYRNFLQSMAQKGDSTQHRANETPLEYQRRLLQDIKQQQHLQAADEQANTTFLSDLTHAYDQERYGNKNIDHQHKETLLAHLPQFIEHLTPKETKTKISGWSAEKARWGED
jgi:hypothetical protein